jgi:hypothetical protein
VPLGDDDADTIDDDDHADADASEKGGRKQVSFRKPAVEDTGNYLSPLHGTTAPAPASLLD